MLARLEPYLLPDRAVGLGAAVATLLGMLDDIPLFDAYSHAVMSVVDSLGPAVVSLAILGRRGGTGSGFIVTPDGYVVTNHHVVENASSIEALLADGRSASAQVVGSDPTSDLALVRLAARDLHHVALDGEVNARPGQLAVAIGSPLGFEATVSAGIVSALDRRLGGRRRPTIEHLIQHTAQLNPGNSGGPLADSKGRVLGVNTAIIQRSQGLGFAVPVEMAAWVTSQLLAHGKVRRSMLGIAARTRPLQPALRRRLETEQKAGVEILSVGRRSPAQAAGLRVRDLIVAIDETQVTSAGKIQRILRDWEVGRPAQLRTVRDGTEHHRTVYPVRSA